MAEDEQRAGHGRATFYPELDASNNVNVGLLVVAQTRAQAKALGTGMYGQVWNQIPAAYKDGRHKNVAFSSVAFNALGGGDLSYVGAYTNIHPNRAADMMSALLSTKLGNDNALTYATYTGVTLHEIIHGIHSIWHDFSLNNIMGGAYDISQYFTLTYSAANPAPHNESSAATLGNQRDLATWNRHLMSADQHPYTDTTVSVTAGPEYLVATSLYPLAVFQYYIPSSATDRHTNLWASGLSTFRKHLGRALVELGSYPFNVMAVDTEGNMSYTSFSGGTVPVVPVDDSYAVSAITATVIAAPGVLGNDRNPSGSTLAAVLATNVSHGTLALSTNGGFTYTPGPDFTGTDTFWYAASDAVSSDQQARVTLTGPPPPPPLTANAGRPQTVTPSAPSVQLGGSPTASGGNSPYTYSWSPSTGLSGATVANPTASPANTTTYTLVVTDFWGMHATNSATVTCVAANTALISVDFVYQVTGGRSQPYAGDTALTGTLNQNAAGEIYAGQVGLWNAMNVGGNNANNSSAYLTNLLNGTGGLTTVSFAMGHATTSGALGGDWRNNWVNGLSAINYGLLRQEEAYGYYPTLTSDHFAWELAGLTPNAHYRLTLFSQVGGSPSVTNVANTVAGVQDVEGDWNWTDITATAAGRIAGRFSASNNATYGIYGLQLERIPLTPPPELPLSSFSRPGGVPTFDIPNTVLSFHHTLAYKDNLTATSWTPLTGLGTGLGNGGTLRLSDPSLAGSPAAQRFYRLERHS